MRSAGRRGAGIGGGMISATAPAAMRLPRHPLLLLIALAACREADGRVVKTGDDDRQQPSGVQRVGSVAGFQGPESVRYDPQQDCFFVSNIVGFGSVKDGGAYISR